MSDRDEVLKEFQRHYNQYSMEMLEFRGMPRSGEYRSLNDAKSLLLKLQIRFENLDQDIGSDFLPIWEFLCDDEIDFDALEMIIQGLEERE